MGMLMWLLLRLTEDPAARIGVDPPHPALSEQVSEGLAEADGHAEGRLRMGEQGPGGPAGSGSVAP
jgi:hypothetical protein